MPNPFLLDSGPLGRIINPQARPDTVSKYRSLIDSGADIVVPQIADYEIRRSLILNDSFESLRRLDELRARAIYLPITVLSMDHAAQLWAKCRRLHRPRAHPHAIDGDMIVAAQALGINGVVVTENGQDFEGLVDWIDWNEI